MSYTKHARHHNGKCHALKENKNRRASYFSLSESERESRSGVSDPLGLHGLIEFSRQDTGVGSRSLLQGIFPTQRSNPGLPLCRWILYQLSHIINVATFYM